MTLEELEELNDRRKVVVNNKEYYKGQLQRFKNRVHEYEEQIATANDLIESIDHTLMEHLEVSTPALKTSLTKVINTCDTQAKSL